MEIIDELEPQRRNAWCSSIGYLSLCGNMDTSITIRTLTAWHDQLLAVPPEAGIVADSEEAAEYQETLIKLIVFSAATGAKHGGWRPELDDFFLSALVCACSPRAAR